MTSLENAVRRLQDALRDARDENTDLKSENQRLTGVLDANGIDHRRQSGDVSLLRPNPSTTSLNNSPSNQDFALAYATGAGSSMANDTYSAFYTPSPNSLPTPDYLSQQKVASQGAGGSNPHSRQVSLDAQGHSPSHFGIPRPGSAASGTSSHSSAHSFHGAFDTSADMEPSISAGGPTTPAIQIGLDELNLYGNSMSLPGNPAGSWNLAGGNEQQQQANAQQNQETDLGRSDTVKASDPRHSHRRVHSHVEAASPSPSAPQMDHHQQQQQQAHDMFNPLVDDPSSSSFEFDPYGAAAAGHHSRPGSSASSLLSNEGELGHHFHHHHPQLHQHQSLSQQQPGSMPAELEDPSYYSSDGDFNDMDYLESMDSTSGVGAGGMALVESLLVPSHPGAGGFPNNGMDMSGGLSSSPMNSNLGGGSPYGGGMFTGAMLASGNYGMNMGMDIVGGNGGAPTGMGLGGGVGDLGAGVPGQGGMGAGNVGDGVSQQQVPMSSTLAAIKAQAFGTSRKARTRAKRPGADSAAKVALEPLQARGLGLGLDVDLRPEGEGPGGSGGASVTRSGATVKRKSKGDDPAQKG